MKKVKKPVGARTAANKLKPKKAAGSARSTARTDLEPVMSRRSGDDRRATERRQSESPVAVDRRKLQRREKVNRRRQIDPTTCERDYSLDEVEFMTALDQYKRKSGRMFPTCSEILEVLRGLGYEKRSAGERPAVEPEHHELPAAEQPSHHHPQ